MSADRSLSSPCSAARGGGPRGGGGGAGGGDGPGGGDGEPSEHVASIMRRILGSVSSGHSLSKNSLHGASAQSADRQLSNPSLSCGVRPLQLDQQASWHMGRKLEMVPDLTGVASSEANR